MIACFLAISGAALAPPAFSNGFGGDSPPARIPIPARDYSAIVEDLKAGRLVKPFDFSLQTNIAYWIVCPHENLRRAKVRVFRDWLLEEARANTLQSASG